MSKFKSQQNEAPELPFCTLSTFSKQVCWLLSRNRGLEVTETLHIITIYSRSEAAGVIISCQNVTSN